MYRDLTRGSISRSLILFALPMIAGNLLQQFYNIADTLIVGRALGSGALAAVGSAYTLMTFLNSIFLGLSMGAGALFSIYRGRDDERSLRLGIVHAFGLILGVTLLLNAAVYLFLEPILCFLRTPESVAPGMREYLRIIFVGLLATSLYNYLSCLLRALGNSTVPLVFLAVSALLNVGLDLIFVLVFHWGIAGAAWATVLAQWVSGVGMLGYFLTKCKHLLPKKSELHYERSILHEILQLSALTCVQQSVMNFGILMVQGLVNSFGETIMAAFAAAVKIDTFAYLPVQDFGNAFSTYVAQNYGAGQTDRIRRGIRSAGLTSALFCVFISVMVCLFAAPLMGIFIAPLAGEHHRRRCPLSAHRGRVLHRHRPPLPALRLLPRRQPAGNVGGADHRLSGHPRCAGLPAVGHPAGRHRHLAQRPHRLGAGGCHRHRILSGKT